MNDKFNLILVLIFTFSHLALAGNGHHEFSHESWSNGKSCLICHDLKSNLPKVFPAGSRIVDSNNLNDQEKAAFANNSNNLMCLVCHQEKHSTITPKISTNPTTGLPTPSVPPVYTSGSEGSTGIRVVNQGLNAADCLHCHDIHSKDSQQLIRADYYQN